MLLIVIEPDCFFVERHPRAIPLHAKDSHIAQGHGPLESLAPPALLQNHSSQLREAGRSEDHVIVCASLIGHGVVAIVPEELPLSLALRIQIHAQREGQAAANKRERERGEEKLLLSNREKLAAKLFLLGLLSSTRCCGAQYWN